ncbi:MAG: cation-translocating P-type ATPase [Verrucomicrobiales bacterium]|nr:cation-translocating P-type ATPase [Verrucomicrobiales bacterium]
MSRFRVTGMTCGNCARHVREAALSVAGVSIAEALPEKDSLTVWWKDAVPMPDTAVAAAVSAAGYPAKVLSESTVAEPSPRFSWKGWGFNTVLGAICTLPLMIGEWIFSAHGSPTFHTLGFVLATIAWLGCGSRFARGAWQQLKVGAFGMDLLVTLGASAAYLFSAVSWILHRPGHLYFMETAAILTFISLGHWIETRVSRQAEGALRALLHLAPSTARRRMPNGEEREVPIAELMPDQEVVLRPGDRIPTDGLVAEGESAVDESMLTGESIPVAKKLGTRLYAGTTNLDGRLVFRVTALGEATALAQIIAAVRRAQSSRASIQRLADRVTQVFVPVVVFVALATFLFWGFWPEAAAGLSRALSSWLWVVPVSAEPWANAVIHATAVLIIACPCAMGLATPAALMAASNAAARRGILLRDAIALEKAGRITTVLFDKTGTLTSGRPTVMETRSASLSESEAETATWLAVASSLAAPSSHPLSQAIAGLSAERMKLDGWKEYRGSGSGALLSAGGGSWKAATEVRLGSLAWTHGSASLAPEVRSAVEMWLSSGATVLCLWVGDRAVLYFALRDQPKEEAKAVVQELRDRGLAVRMVSGDSVAAARGIGLAVGLAEAEVFAEVKPESKADLLKQLQAQGHRVAFVGDGINDAPALAQADLGIAVTRASDIARESADLVLLRADLHAVPESLSLAGATLRIIRQNLFWAFVYNALAVPLAALGFMNPMLCALSMGLSDVLVIGNSLRLLRVKK